jgi:hypothetical protein
VGATADLTLDDIPADQLAGASPGVWRC